MSGHIKITDPTTGEVLYDGEIINRSGRLVEAGMIAVLDEGDPAYQIVIEP